MNLFCSFVLGVIIELLVTIIVDKIVGAIRFMLKHRGAKLHDYRDYLSQNAKDDDY